MSRQSKNTDLFGSPVRVKRPRYEATIERHDKAELPDRARRVRWLNSVMPKHRGYMMPLESHLVFSEAKNSFIYGQYVASIVLAASFIEHWLGVLVAQAGFEKEQRKGLAAIIKCARENGILHSALCNKAEYVRKIRNPFVHLKSFDHPDTIAQRAFVENSGPFELLEPDAKNALVAMYSVAAYAKA